MNKKVTILVTEHDADGASHSYMRRLIDHNAVRIAVSYCTWANHVGFRHAEIVSIEDVPDFVH